jgi:hypothetical protein
MGRVQGGARAAFAKVCKMSVAGGCLQTLMTECSYGRVSVNSELGHRPHEVHFAFKKNF